MYDLPTRDTRTFYLFKYVLLSFDLKPSFKICRLKLITIRQPNLGKDIYLYVNTELKSNQPSQIILIKDRCKVIKHLTICISRYLLPSLDSWKYSSFCLQLIRAIRVLLN